MLSVKERMLKENLVRVLGDRPETELIFRAKTGRISQEEIQEYERKRDEETEYFKTLFEFDKPPLPSIFEPEPNKTVILSDHILKNGDSKIRRNQDEGDENIISLDKEQ